MYSTDPGYRYCVAVIAKSTNRSPHRSSRRSKVATWRVRDPPPTLGGEDDVMDHVYAPCAATAALSRSLQDDEGHCDDVACKAACYVEEV